MDPGKERAERVLANAISIDGRKEWTCKFCSESNVPTRWRCRRGYSNNPAGLHGKYRKAVAAKSGEWSSGSSASSGEEDRRAQSLGAEHKELRPRINAMEKKEGVQKAPGIPFLKKGTRKMCGESSWKSKMRLSVAEHWMNRRKSCRRSYERSTDCLLFPRKFRRVSRSHCSTSCKMWTKKEA